MIRLHRELVEGSPHAARLAKAGVWRGDFLELPEEHYAPIAGYTPAPPPTTVPPMEPETIGSTSIAAMQRLGSLLAASVKWLWAGCPITPRTLARRRLELCQTCPNWRPEAWAGTGGCRLCGCTRLKLEMATSRCPLAPPKW